MNALNELFPPYPLPPANHAGVFMDAKAVEVFYPTGSKVFFIMFYVLDENAAAVGYAQGIDEAGVWESGSGYPSKSDLLKNSADFSNKVIDTLKGREKYFSELIKRNHRDMPKTNKCLAAIRQTLAALQPQPGQQIRMF